MHRTPLDYYDRIPTEMRQYLRHYGWHFNKKACEYAVSLMRKKSANGSGKAKIEMMTKEQVDTLLSTHNIELENNIGYDHVFAANMCKADFLGSSVPDEEHLALYVMDTIDDIDAGDGHLMRRWYATMVSNGTPVDWGELL